MRILGLASASVFQDFVQLVSSFLFLVGFVQCFLIVGSHSNMHIPYENELTIREICTKQENWLYISQLQVK